MRGAQSGLLARYPGIASIARNGSALSFSQVGDALIRGVYALLIGGILGAAQYGIWSLVATVYMAVVTVISLGLESLLEAKAGVVGRPSNRLIQTSLAIRIASLTVVAAISVPAIFVFESNEALRIAFFLAVPALVARSLTMWARSILTARENAFGAMKIAVASRLGEVFLGIGMLLAGQDIYVLLALHSAIWIAEAGLTLRKAASHAPILDIHLNRSEAKAVLLDGLLVGLTVSGIAILNAAPVLLGRLAGISLAGIGNLGIALQISALGIFFVQGFLSAAFPILNRAEQRGDKRVYRFAMVSFFLIGSASSAVAVLAYLFGTPALTFTLGQDYTVAGEILPLALIIGGVCAAPIGFWQILIVRDKPTSGAIAVWLGIIAGLVSYLALLFRFGLVGILLAVTIAWTVRAMILLVSFRCLVKQSHHQNPT